MKSVLVIGAGVAGLLAAQDLQQHGFDVTVLDKGRGLGGRMATRRLPIGERVGKADHGVQYITAYTPRFDKLVQEMKEQNILQPWTLGTQNAHTAKRFRYIAPDGMTAVAKYFARDINVCLNERVHTLAIDDQHWIAQTDNTKFSADMLLITAPIPQTLMLLQTIGQSILTEEEYSALSSVQYIPCITLMLALKNDYLSKMGSAKMKFEGGRTIMWVADNREKGISPDVPTLTIHTSAEFANEHWETKEEELLSLLFSEIQPSIPQEMVQAYSLHRWRYSRVAKPYPALFFSAKHISPPLVLAGDAFAGETPLVTRVEDAAVSGWAAAEYISSLVK